MTKKRMDQADASIKKLQTTVTEINNLNKKIQLLVSQCYFDREIGIKNWPNGSQ